MKAWWKSVFKILSWNPEIICGWLRTTETRKKLRHGTLMLLPDKPRRLLFYTWISRLFPWLCMYWGSFSARCVADIEKFLIFSMIRVVVFRRRSFQALAWHRNLRAKSACKVDFLASRIKKSIFMFSANGCSNSNQLISFKQLPDNKTFLENKSCSEFFFIQLFFLLLPIVDFLILSDWLYWKDRELNGWRGRITRNKRS